MGMDGYSLSDLKAVTGDDDSFGGGFWWIIILFLFMFNGNGFGGLKDNGATASTQQEILYNQQFDRLGAKLESIGNGICDSTYALNTAIVGEGRSIQNQLATCCCETNRNIDAIRYENAKNTCDITTAIHAEGEATRGLIQANEMQSLRDKVMELSFAQSQCSQNAYLVNTLRPYPTPAYPAASMFPSCGC